MQLSDYERTSAFEHRGKLGFSAGVGFARCGYSRCGSSKLIGGIYSRKKRFSGTTLSRMKYYRPTNPQTTEQQSWRSVFADAMLAWQSLSAPEKDAYKRRALAYRMLGHNLFLREYLNSHLL